MAELSERMPEAVNVARPAASFAIGWAVLIALIAAALCLPSFPIIFSLGDEGVLLHGAQRMLQGQVIYKDFFEFLPPAGFLLTEAWLWLAGVSVWSARTLAVANIAAITCLTFLACRRASGSPQLSAALAMSWLILSQGAWTQVSHHWLTTLFSMVTVWAAMSHDGKERSVWPWIAGGAAGIAAMVTPTCGALAMVAGLSGFIAHRRTLLSYVAASLTVPAMLLIYLAWLHAVPAAFHDIIVLTASRYAPINYLPFGSRAGLAGQPVAYVFVFPVAAVLGLLVYFRDGGSRVFLTCAACAIAGFVGCFPRADVFHILFLVPMACPLLAYAAVRLTARWRAMFRRVAVYAALLLMVPPVIVYGELARYFRSGEVTQTPRGDLTFLQLDGAPEMIARIAAVKPGEGWFFYPFIPMLPFLTDRQDVARYDVFTPQYTLPAEYQETCVAVLSRAAWVVIDRQWTDPVALKSVFPAMKDPRPRETAQFEKILDQDFDLVAQEGMFELRRRNGVGGASDCAAITQPSPGS